MKGEGGFYIHALKGEGGFYIHALKGVGDFYLHALKEEGGFYLHALKEEVGFYLHALKEEGGFYIHALEEEGGFYLHALKEEGGFYIYALKGEGGFYIHALKEEGGFYLHAQSSLQLNSIFPTPLPLPSSAKSYIRLLFDYGAPATCVASPAIQLSLEGIQIHFISRALSIPSFIHKDRKRQHAYLPHIHDRNLYLAKRCYRRAMQYNRGVQDYIDNHTHDKRNNTPLELIRN